MSVHEGSVSSALSLNLAGGRWRSGVFSKLMIHALLKAMRGQELIQSHHHADRYQQLHLKTSLQ
jgi:hypothetical protein